MNFTARFTIGIFLLTTCTAQAAITLSGNVTPRLLCTWNSSTTAYIGNTSAGSLTVDDGNALFSENGFLGFSSSAIGTATISDANSIWNSTNCYIGHNGVGEMNILGSGKVCSNQGILGAKMRSTGIVNVSGAGSTWENSDELIIGCFGNGQLNISEAGNVINHNNCQISFDSSSTSTVNVSGDGSTWFNKGNLCVGNGGTGELNITENGLACVAGTLTIDANNNGESFINMASGGMLALRGNANNSVTIFLDTIQGSGTIRYRNKPRNNWAALATATIDVDYTLEYLTEGELNGYTLLTILDKSQGKPIDATLPGDANGDGVVDGSDLTILAGNWQVLTGATLSMGDFNGDGAVDGSDLTILASNWQSSTKKMTTAAVPEPSHLLMLLFGLLTLGFVRHMR